MEKNKTQNTENGTFNRQTITINNKYEMKKKKKNVDKKLFRTRRVETKTADSRASNRFSMASSVNQI